MYVKRILSLIIAIILLITAVSCSSGTGSKVTSANSDTLKSGNSKELTMYIIDFDTSAQRAVEKFNQAHKDVQIKSKTLTANELGGKLMYGLNSGGGPDIIIGMQDTLPNLSVFFNKGSFYDLNTLIDNDKTFKKSDYFEKVLDYGVYKDKRYVLPLSFEIDSLYTTKDIIEKGGQGITNKGAGIDEFVEAANKHALTVTDKSNSFVSYIDIASLLQTAAKPFFNLSEKTARFDTKEFGDLIDKYKVLSDKMAAKVLSASPSEKNSLLSTNKVVFQNVMTMNPRYTADPFGSFITEVEPVILPSVYADTTRHIIAKPEKYIGINSKCGNIGAAYEFVKMMLSMEYQDVGTMEGIPVNREAYEQVKDNCIKGMKGYDLWKKGGCKNTNTIKKLFTQMDEVIAGIDKCWTEDEYLLTIVRNEVGNYLKNNSTKENTLKTIQQKVDGYLKSGFMAETAAKEDETPADPLKTLSLYYWNCTEMYVLNSMREYDKKYPDSKLKLKIFNSYEDFYKTTGIELMAGGGPDIVIFQPRFFNSVNKVIETGALCAMDEYIEKYHVLNYEDYNLGILDHGILNGKRYYLPLLMYYSPLLSRESLMKESGIAIKEGDWTLQRFVDYSKEYMKKNKNNNKYFLQYGFGVYQILRNSGVEFMDYKSKKSNFNSAEFRDILRLCKELAPAINPKHYKLAENVGKEKNLFFNAECVGNPSFAKIDYSEISNIVKDDMVVVPTPTLKGEYGNYSLLSDCIGVNSKCRNKEAAFNFVKIAVSFEMQKEYDSLGKINYCVEAPANKKSYSDDLLAFQAKGLLPKKFTDSLIKNYSIFKIAPIKDFNIFEMVVNISNEYIDGKKTMDQVVKEIDGKANVFLNE